MHVPDTRVLLRALPMLVCVALLVGFWAAFVERTFNGMDSDDWGSLVLHYVFFIASFTMEMLWPALTHA